MNQPPNQLTSVRQSIIRAIIANLKVALLIIIFTCGVLWAMGELDLQTATTILLGWIILALVVGYSRGRKGRI